MGIDFRKNLMSNTVLDENIYETVIGLEVHIELATESKLFCSCTSKFGGKPNTHVCPVCTGMPGTLPVLNRQAVRLAAAVGLALNCRINRYCRFDRKNYFYPDNPQNYQISQLYIPLCEEGSVSVRVGDEEKTIRIHEIHLEDDAGKLIHEGNVSLVDYNRSGVPLIEIVTEPDFRNADEVTAFLESLQLTARYTGASDCRMQEGSMRADVNLSVRRKDNAELGIRTETKNLSSFRAISEMIAAESRRQIRILESGGEIVQETRHWDEAEKTSYSMRSKEDAQDYRYFPDPDLPPLRLDEKWIETLKGSLPELQPQKKARYVKDYSLPEYDAEILTGSVRLAGIFEETVRLGAEPKKVSNWLMGETLYRLKENGMQPEELMFSPKNLARLIAMNESGSISNAVAKEIFGKLFTDNVDPEEYAAAHGLAVIREGNELEEAVDSAVSENPKAVQQYREGRTKVLGFLLGQVMQKTGGRADPAAVRSLLVKKLQ